MSFALSQRVASSRAVVRAARPAVRSTRTVIARPCVVVRAEPKKDAVEVAIKEAEEACAGGSTGECAAAWDTVEEISAAAADKRVADASAENDPLEKYCKDNPETDECRVYDD